MSLEYNEKNITLAKNLRKNATPSPKGYGLCPMHL